MIERLQHRAAALLGLATADITVTIDRHGRLFTVTVRKGVEVVPAVWTRTHHALNDETRPDVVVYLASADAPDAEALMNEDARATAAKLPASMADAYLYGRRLAWEGVKEHAIVHHRYAKLRAAYGADAAHLATRHELATAESKIAHGEAYCAFPHRYLAMLDILTPLTIHGAPCPSST